MAAGRPQRDGQEVLLLAALPAAAGDDDDLPVRANRDGLGEVVETSIEAAPPQFATGSRVVGDRDVVERRPRLLLYPRTKTFEPSGLTAIPDGWSRLALAS